jgi:hypothetical protein
MLVAFNASSSGARRSAVLPPLLAELVQQDRRVVILPMMEKHHINRSLAHCRISRPLVGLASL